MPSIQKQISLIFNKKKQQIFVDYFTYYIDLDNNLYEITVENHDPIIHNKITNYESILDALEIKFHKGGPK
ncbi:hypothetical protein DWY83_03650 [Coprobacillus sp. AF27-24BH]|jgi:hypothetical protein|nr:hypothetical protein DWY83_03650 [Coprobacillus sp. AF27-24BH]RGH54451.1 hypothetical protein DW863_02630 [Coprobacillus sp. AM37-9BH]RHR91760.1 hypothetical protein DWW38_02915 [Coprobacillus sp. AF15-30]